jgi:hypothetical protein
MALTRSTKVKETLKTQGSKGERCIQNERRKINSTRNKEQNKEKQDTK